VLATNNETITNRTASKSAIGEKIVLGFSICTVVAVIYLLSLVDLRCY